VARAVAADAALDFDPALAHVGTTHEVGDGIVFFLAKPSQTKREVLPRARIFSETGRSRLAR
jgi:hypothetical protein